VAAYAAVCAAPAAFGLCPRAPVTLLTGDSAGGLLAVALALHIRDANAAAAAAARGGGGGAPPPPPLIAPRLLVPFYPAVDARTMRPSRSRYAEGYILSHFMFASFGKHLLGETREERARWHDDRQLHLLLNERWEGLPKTIVITAEHDILHDEGVALVDAMRAGGGSAVHVEGRGLVHGFVTEVAHECCAEVVRRVAADMRAAVVGDAAAAAPPPPQQQPAALQ